MTAVDHSKTPIRGDDSLIQNYRKAGTENDVTRFMETLNQYYGPHTFVVRPFESETLRFMESLCQYCDVKSPMVVGIRPNEAPGDGNSLNPHRKYRTLKFDFSRLASETDWPTAFAREVMTGLKAFAGRYSFAGADSTLSKDYVVPGLLLDAFLSKAAVAYGRSIFVIINGCDGMLSKRPSDQHRLKGYLEDFYRKLKRGTKTTVARTILVGDSAASLPFVTPGFNNLDLVDDACTS